MHKKKGSHMGFLFYCNSVGVSAQQSLMHHDDVVLLRHRLHDVGHGYLHG